nr:hypothetical protein BaRGS_009315 [Batillaria attramentaria]
MTSQKTDGWLRVGDAVKVTSVKEDYRCSIRELIDADLHYADLDTLYFLDTATTCFNETNYFTRSYQAPGDYAYQCVCPSPRKRVERIYLNNDVCFVVYPEKQDVQYAQCGGHCSFDYGTRIATSTRGYFCVYQSYVQRQFLVWCPNLAAQAGKVVPAPQQVNGHQLYGRFERVTQNLPTLCSCRGYFCDNHAVHGGPGGIHSQIGGVPAIH